jgi:hypothetical protein
MMNTLVMKTPRMRMPRMRTPKVATGFTKRQCKDAAAIYDCSHYHVGVCPFCSTALSKAQPTAVEVADPRWSTQTFAVFSKGVNILGVEDAVSAIMLDMLSGKIDHDAAAAHISVVDRILQTEDCSLATRFRSS